MLLRYRRHPRRIRRARSAADVWRAGGQRSSFWRCAIAVASRQSLAVPQHRSHPRAWRDNLYVYPVISRRSGGLSIGVNLNPDTACNFDCVYCQVDRTGTPRVREVDPARVQEELAQMVGLAQSGELFEDQGFRNVPEGLRAVKDIAFSGDGEPTTCKWFAECVQIAANVKRKAGLDETRIVLITDACYLTRPNVAAGLAIMDRNQGEVWAKLDAGTEEYYRRINRPNYPLQHVIDNIVAAARVRPVVIQSLFMRVHDEPPPEAEISAFTDRLNEITRAGGRIEHVQVYTVARAPAQPYVSSLTHAEVDEIVRTVQDRTGLRAEGYY